MNRCDGYVENAKMSKEEKIYSAVVSIDLPWDCGGVK
jgi:hypothetical protein